MDNSKENLDSAKSSKSSESSTNYKSPEITSIPAKKTYSATATLSSPWISEIVTPPSGSQPLLTGEEEKAYNDNINFISSSAKIYVEVVDEVYLPSTSVWQYTIKIASGCASRYGDTGAQGKNIIAAGLKVIADCVPATNSSAKYNPQLSSTSDSRSIGGYPSSFPLAKVFDATSVIASAAASLFRAVQLKVGTLICTATSIITKMASNAASSGINNTGGTVSYTWHLGTGVSDCYQFLNVDIKIPAMSNNNFPGGFDALYTVSFTTGDSIEFGTGAVISRKQPSSARTLTEANPAACVISSIEEPTIPRDNENLDQLNAVITFYKDRVLRFADQLAYAKDLSDTLRSAYEKRVGQVEALDALEQEASMLANNNTDRIASLSNTCLTIISDLKEATNG